MKPIIGFAPDADPTTPGVLTDCQHLVPFEAGFRGAPSPIAAAVATLADSCRGAAVVVKLDGTRRVFAGTQTAIHELTGGVWTDRSKSGGYIGSTESRWSICQFGDTTVCSNLVDEMQSSNAGDFADIAGAPKAKIVVSASNNFVIAFNTNDGTYGVSPDRWWCCAQGNQADWLPSVATGATTGRLVAVEGAIQAALPLGDGVVAYKGRGIFLGQFVGATQGSWAWTQIRGAEAGAVGSEAVCDIGGVHFFVSNDDFYLFDGTAPVSIGDGVLRRWWTTNCSPVWRYSTSVSYDRRNSLVRVRYPSKNSAGELDRCLVYHTKRKAWGIDDGVTQATLNYISPGVTINGLDSYAATINALPAVPLDSQFWMGGGETPAFFDASNQLQSLSGECGASSLTTGDIGDDDAVTMIDRFRMRYTLNPTTATATGLRKWTEGEALTPDAVCNLNDGKFDLRQSGRWHRVRVDMTGDHSETLYAPVLKVVGGR